MKKNRITKVLVCLLAFSLTAGIAACGPGQRKKEAEETGRISSDQIRKENEADEGTQKQGEDTKGSKRTEYPLTIKTYGADGKEYTTTYEKAPENVAAVYQGSVETLLMLGLEDRIAATAGLDNEVPDDQKAAFSKTEYLDEFTPSKETMTMLEPDLIVSWASLFSDDTLGSPEEWIGKGTNVYINTNTAVKTDALEHEYEDILNIGKIFDVQDRAEEIVNEMKETIENVKSQVGTPTEKTTAMVVESIHGSFTNYGASSIAGDMVTQLGGELSNPDASSVGKEDIISANPDVIFVVYMPYAGDDPETVRQEHLDRIQKDEAFQSLDAVKNGRVVPIMLSEMYASATRTKDGIVTIAKGLYPNLDLKE